MHGDGGEVVFGEVLGDLLVLGVWPSQVVALGVLETDSSHRLYLSTEYHQKSANCNPTGFPWVGAWTG